MTDQILNDTFDEIENELSVLRRLAFAAIEEKAAKHEILCKGVRLVHDGRLEQLTKMASDAAKEYGAALNAVESFYPDKSAEAKAKAERPRDADDGETLLGFPVKTRENMPLDEITFASGGKTVTLKIGVPDEEV